MTGISGFGGSVTGVGYYTAAPKIGLLKQYSYSNGRSTTLDYTNRRMPLKTLAPVFQKDFTYDNRGNLKTFTDRLQPTRKKSFSYDRLNRLTGFTGPWGSGTFSYAAGGDRTMRTVAGKTDTYSYSNNLLLSGAGKSFSYNADGDLTQIIQGGTVHALSYDTFHRMLSYKSSTTPLAEFGYDAHGGRAYKKSGGTTTNYFEDHGNGNILSEIPDNDPPTNYVYLGSTLVAKLGAADYPVAFYHTDPYGTPHVMTGSDGSIIWQGDYFPFGQEYDITTAKTANKKRFIGKEKDAETGLDYFGARYMDDGLGRFISADPVGLVDARTGRSTPRFLLIRNGLTGMLMG